ncbi:inactive pancreatic lipase-related protein 1-like [Amblyomma americanum]
MENQPQVVISGGNSATCYDGVGCFNTTDHMRLYVGGPQSPEKVGTKFIFYSTNTPEGEEVSVHTWDSIYAKKGWDLRKRLVGIIHGFTESGRRKWVLLMKDALLKIDANVIVVDWKKGAAQPRYLTAARNAPMPGVLLSMLLQKMIQSSKRALERQKVHVVGFSLGAQVAGFCGRHFLLSTKTKIGRITGLDPAGPLFDNSQACLSKNDAEFVDVIHTNAGKLLSFRYGLNKAAGHADFWPNGGSDQPGCTSGILRLKTCSHDKGPGMFTESLTNHGCKFKSYHCAGGWAEYKTGYCQKKARPQDIGEMGYYSHDRQGRGDQYLITYEKPPQCIPRNSA